jgi:hypothetical protein
MQLWEWSEISYWWKNVSPRMSLKDIKDRFMRFEAAAFLLYCYRLVQSLVVSTGGEEMLDMCLKSLKEKGGFLSRQLQVVA